MAPKNRTVRLTTALVAPFVTQAILLILLRQFERHLIALPKASDIWALAVLGLGPIAISSITGFVILAQDFRRYRMLFGVVYFVVMVALLSYFSLLFMGFVYDDWL